MSSCEPNLSLRLGVRDWFRIISVNMIITIQQIEDIHERTTRRLDWRKCSSKLPGHILGYSSDKHSSLLEYTFQSAEFVHPGESLDHLK